MRTGTASGKFQNRYQTTSCVWQGIQKSGFNFDCHSYRDILFLECQNAREQFTHWFAKKSSQLQRYSVTAELSKQLVIFVDPKLTNDKETDIYGVGELWFWCEVAWKKRCMVLNVSLCFLFRLGAAFGWACCHCETTGSCIYRRRSGSSKSCTCSMCQETGESCTSVHSKAWCQVSTLVTQTFDTHDNQILSQQKLESVVVGKQKYWAG